MLLIAMFLIKSTCDSMLCNYENALQMTIARKQLLPDMLSATVELSIEPFSDAKNSCLSTFSSTLRVFLKRIVKLAIRLPTLKDNTMKM